MWHIIQYLLQEALVWPLFMMVKIRSNEYVFIALSWLKMA